MNGISLLLLLSSVGVSTNVETGTNGQPVYVIRVESLLVSQLRSGESIPILVAPRDRRLRHFKIAVTPDSSLRGGASARTSDVNSRGGDLFDYEPTQLENGEIEYVVQISPERLESLAAGKAIEGDISANIDEVHRFLIFVGIGELPSQQQAAAQQQANAAPPVTLAGNASPPSLIRGAEGRAAPATINRSTTAPATKTPFPASTTNSTPRYQSTDPLAQNTTRPGDLRTTWRNGPDQSTINPPPFTGIGQPTAQSGSSYPRSLGTPTTNDRNGYATQPNYNNTYPQGNYDPNAGYNQPNQGAYLANQGGYAGNQGGYGQQNYPANPSQGYGNQQLLPGQPMATVAARNDLPNSQPANMNHTNLPANATWNQPATPMQTAAPAAAVAGTTTPVVKAEVEKDRPWTPLILTTLALFASLGANAYLGWLAWSFFWRFRDAVTESARTRAQMSSSRAA